MVNYLEPGKNWQELQKELDAEPEPDEEDRQSKKSDYFEDVPSDTTYPSLFFFFPHYQSNFDYIRYSESGSEVDPDDEADWEDWEEEEDEASTCVCLFCPATHPAPEQTLSHLKKEHDFDLFALQKEWKIDYYGCIKMINCIFSL